MLLLDWLAPSCRLSLTMHEFSRPANLINNGNNSITDTARGGKKHRFAATVPWVSGTLRQHCCIDNFLYVEVLDKKLLWKRVRQYDSCMPTLDYLEFEDLGHNHSRFLRAVRMSNRTPLFPALKKIRIECVNCAGWTADSSFFSSLPKICHFTYRNDHPDAYNILKSLYDNSSVDRISWPELEIIDIVPNSWESLVALAALVSYRKSIGKPLRHYVFGSAKTSAFRSTHRGWNGCEQMSRRLNLAI
jgi:hypothetical protein